MAYRQKLSLFRLERKHRNYSKPFRKALPDGAAHSYMAYLREYPHSPGRCLTAFPDALLYNFTDVSGKETKRWGWKRRRVIFNCQNTIDGCGAYLVRASSSHKRALVTKKAKQLCTCCISCFCVHFWKLMRDYNEKFSNPTFYMGCFFLYLNFEVDPKDQLQKLIYYRKIVWFEIKRACIFVCFLCRHRRVCHAKSDKISKTQLYNSSPPIHYQDR